MSERYSPLWELTMARVREVIREPGIVFWIFGFPVLMAIGLGIAFRERPPEPPTVAVVEGSPWLAEALDEPERLQVQVLDRATARERLRTGRVDLVIEARGPEPEAGVGYRYDEMRDEGRLARYLADAVLQGSLSREDPAPTREELVTEKGSRYIDFLMPGLIGLNLMGSSMWGIGYSIVLARKRRQLRRFAATPMRRSHFMAAYLLSRLVFLVLELAGLVGLGFLAFGVTIHGSVISLVVVALLGAASFGAIGLLVAARVRSVEAANGWMNFIMMPMWILSGTFFAYTRFPELVHPLLRALPLTALIDGLRAIVNDGTGLAGLGVELGVMIAWGVVAFVLALRWFRWQ
ncbi:MAG: ABC transporter permease [Myxococcales bacterium]|nr:ABC transporter permease [Myxococcales bacterium]MCB9715307.1 ABC transporter permease [Myxococcales bacterium]